MEVTNDTSFHLLVDDGFGLGGIRSDSEEEYVESHLFILGDPDIEERI